MAERKQGRTARPIPPGLTIPPQLEDLLPRFVAEMARDCRILAGLVGGERAAIAEHAHAMRGKCAMFGAAEMAELLGVLEDLAPAAPPREIDRLVATIIGRAQLLAVYSESIM